jgi:outer membrane protein OmpA-like peptidoglycan-associated protein
MKKQLIVFLIVCFYFPNAFSQDFLGLGTGNYAGVTGVMLQPASIVDSRFKFDINLFSSDVNYSNNYFLLDRNAILKFNKNNFDNYNTFKDRYLSEGSLPAGQKVFFNINSRTQLPLSFMVTTGKKSAIAFNMQFRTVIQGRGITQDFANLAFNNFYPSANNPSVNASGISINSLSWAEADFTYGRVLYSSGTGFLKAAITGKYLAGLSSISLSSNDLQMRVNGDSTFNFNSSNISYNHSSNADFNNLFNKNFSPSANSIGFDAGLVYEYRGNLDKFKYIKSDDETSYDALRRDVSKYIFKVGVSLLDVGMFKFDKPADVSSFSANINNWNLRNAHYNSLKEFDTALAARVVANPNDPRNYNVYLPTALSGQLDVKFVKGLFLNVMSYWPVSLGSSAGNRFTKYGFYTITPRYETRHFGIYFPYTVSQRNDFTDYKNHLLGATLRLGPVFIGSSNLGTMIFDKNLRAADVHIGFKVGFTYGKPNKSNKFLNTIFKKNQQVLANPSVESENYQTGNNANNENSKNTDNPRLLLNYKDGKVYENRDGKQNIIIINNYYGISPAQSGKDTVTVQNSFPTYYADSLNAQTFEIARQRNKIISDSISKITTDSLKMKRTQLDSLIKSMQRLQMQMDSANRTGNSFNNEPSSNNATAIRKAKATNDNLRNANDSLQRIATSINRTDSNNERSSGNVLAIEKLAASNDSLRNVNDRLQRTGMQINGMDGSQKDTATAYPNNQNSTSSTIKKKDELAKEHVVTQNKTGTTLASADDNTAAETARIQTAQTQSNTKELQSMREQQNNLYRQYADQSAMLANDINRLNKRLTTTRENERNNVKYVPVPITVPYNNSGYTNRQGPPQVTTSTVANVEPLKKTDTVYIRDTVTIVPAADTVTHVVTRKTQPDTVVIKDSVKQPSFNYAALPEDIVLFGVGKSDVQPIYDTRLNFIADILNKNPGLQVIVTGHTDATGSKAINEKLSLQRAEAVSYFLMNKGVSKKQITIKSLSSEKPAVTGGTPTARSQNRRVSIKLTKLKE